MLCSLGSCFVCFGGLQPWPRLLRGRVSEWGEGPVAAPEGEGRGVTSAASRSPARAAENPGRLTDRRHQRPWRGFGPFVSSFRRAGGLALVPLHRGFDGLGW